MAVTLLEKQSAATMSVVWEQLPMLSTAGELVPVGALCDEAVFRGSMPCVVVPAHCRKLAEKLNICLRPSIELVARALHSLCAEENKDVNAYLGWLVHLRLAIASQSDGGDGGAEEWKDEIKLYFPDSAKEGGDGLFVSLADVVCCEDAGAALVCEALGKALVFSGANAMYLPFVDTVFKSLGVQTAPTIADVVKALRITAREPRLFHRIGLSNTLLNSDGVTAITLGYQLLEKLLRQRCGRAEQEFSAATLCTASWRHSLAQEVWGDDATLIQDFVGEGNEGFPWMLYDHSVHWNQGAEVRACLEPTLLDAIVRRDVKGHFVDSGTTFACPFLLAALQIPYVEHSCMLVWRHDNNNLENELSEISQRFRKTLRDPAISVVACGYLNMELCTSLLQLSPETFEDLKESCSTYRIEASIPFVVCGPTVVCLTSYIHDASTKAAVFVAALARLCEVRRGMSHEEATMLARASLSGKLALDSRKHWKGAGGLPTVCTADDVVFPSRDCVSVVQQLTLAGLELTAGQAEEDDQKTAPLQSLPGVAVASARVKDNLLFVERAKEILASEGATAVSAMDRGVWVAPAGSAKSGVGGSSGSSSGVIVDSEQSQVIGFRAEHFLCQYLQSVYGEDFNPLLHWRHIDELIDCSNRLIE